MRPISASGWRTVVSCGVTIVACSTSSNPTIERCSRNAQAALGGRPHRADRDVVVEREDRRRRIAEVEQARSCLLALGDLEVGLDLERGIERDSRRGERGAVAAPAVLGRHPAGRAGDRARCGGGRARAGGASPGRRPTCAPRKRRGCGRRAAAADRRRRTGTRPRGALELLARLLGQDDQRPVGRRRASTGRAATPRGRARAGWGEHDAHVLLVQRLRRAGEDLREVDGVDERDEHADQAGPAGGEPARVAVRGVALLRMTRWTASRVSSATSSRPLRTRETVAIETPARSAISRIVIRLPLGTAIRPPLKQFPEVSERTGPHPAMQIRQPSSSLDSTVTKW